MLLFNILVHGSIFAFILTIYLLAVMRFASPRLWAFSDYPPAITEHVPPQTISEKRLAFLLGVPFFVIGIGIPFWFTFSLRILYGGFIPLLDTFLNVFGVIMFGNLADFLLLDLLIVGTITPQFVMIPGSEHMKDNEYKEFRLYHAKGHLKGLIPLLIISLIIAVMFIYFVI
jgi:hypothetical protein